MVRFGMDTWDLSCRWKLNSTRQPEELTASNVSAAQLLHSQKRKKEKCLRIERTAVDQLVLASELQPRRFRTRYRADFVPGSDCEARRRDFGEGQMAGRFRGSVAGLIDSDALLRDDPASRKLLGVGCRAGTIRARVRSIRKFLGWLATAHEIPYPTSHMHMAEFL